MTHSSYLHKMGIQSWSLRQANTVIVYSFALPTREQDVIVLLDCQNQSFTQESLLYTNFMRALGVSEGVNLLQSVTSGHLIDLPENKIVVALGKKAAMLYKEATGKTPSIQLPALYKGLTEPYVKRVIWTNLRCFT